MELQLNGKRALVTGSSSGIGAGIARVLAAEGAIVIVHGRDATRARQVAAEIQNNGGQAQIALGDLATDSGCANVADAVMHTFGGIDILVNNAGGRACSHRQDGKAGPQNAPWLEIPWSDWQWTFEQNVGAAVRLIQRFVPGMRARNWGRIITIASAAATQTVPDLAEYQAVKAGLVNMTTSLAKSLAHSGITVNTVTPGTILTPAVVNAYRHWAQLLGWQTQDWSEIERRFTTEVIPQPVNHFGQPEDIGRVVALLASPLSSYMTGANYRVDGGQCQSIN